MDYSNVPWYLALSLLLCIISFYSLFGIILWYTNLWIAMIPLPYRVDEDQLQRFKATTEPLELPEVVIETPWTRAAKGIMNIELINEENWIKIDKLKKLYSSYQAQRQNERNVMCIAPEYASLVREASLELLDYIIDNLQKNYTKCDIVKRKDDKNILNMITNEVYNVDKMHPLMICRQLIQDDVVIMVRNSENIHILAGAVIMFPDNWALEEKVGLPLAAIHYPIHYLNPKEETVSKHTVPSSNTILRAFESFFDKLYDPTQENAVYLRYNWAFQNHPSLLNRFDSWIGSAIQSLVLLLFFGNDESKELLFRWYLRELMTILINNITFAIGDYRLISLYLRTERQTLRRLPKTNTVAFLVRPQLTDIDVAIDSKEKAAALIDALKTETSSRNGKIDNSGKGSFKEEVVFYLQSMYKV